MSKSSKKIPKKILEPKSDPKKFFNVRSPGYVLKATEFATIMAFDDVVKIEFGYFQTHVIGVDRVHTEGFIMARTMAEDFSNLLAEKLKK